MKKKNKYTNFSTIKFLLIIIPSALIIEYLRINYDIPLTILDLIITPGSLILIIYIIKASCVKNKSGHEYNPMDSVTTTKIILFITVFLFMVGLGFWAAVTGILNPFGYFSGIKGAAHGYTMIFIGILISSLGVYGIFKSVSQLRKRGKNYFIRKGL